MKYYAQYQYMQTNCIVVDRLGSDGVLVLDGRFSLPHMISICRLRAPVLSNIYKAHSFKIYKAERFGEGKLVCIGEL